MHLFVSLVSVSKAAQRHTFWCDCIKRDAEPEHPGDAPFIITPHLISPRQQMLRILLDTLEHTVLVGFQQHCFH